MDITFDKRITNVGFLKGDSFSPYLHNSEFDSRWRSINPHFSFIVFIPNRVVNIWTYELAYWLLYNIGTNHEDWEWWWDSEWPSSGHSAGWKFEFKEEEDKVKFILRWL